MRLSDVLYTMRPRQWTKNLLLFAGLVFSHHLFDSLFVLRSFASFLLFCALSGSVYIFNDVCDVEQDRRHPLKRHRPIASGHLGVRTAWAFGLVVAALSVLFSFMLRRSFGGVAFFYIVLMLAYSLWLKHVVILDVLVVATGFVLRAVAGAVVIHVEISSWLLICTILLALFLALSKRRHELVLLENGAGEHRPILTEYSSLLLDQMIAVVTSSTVMAYALYTISDETVRKFGTKNLQLTIPLVLYGIFRYLYLIHQKNMGGSPEKVLFTDKPLLLSIAFWAGMVLYILYLR